MTSGTAEPCESTETVKTLPAEASTYFPFTLWSSVSARFPALPSVLLFFGAIALGASSPEDQFANANRLYEQARYADAANAYETILERGQSSAALHFNLGNARFRNGQIGLAIAQYHLAQRLAPRDPDIRANLQFARQSVAGPASIRRPAWVDQLGRLSLDEWSTLASAFLWIFLGLLILGRFRPAIRRPLRFGILASAVATSLFGLTTLTVWHYHHRQPIAIVVQPQIPVRYGPLAESQIHFEVRDGTELAVTDSQGDWVQVIDSAKRSGWANRTNVVVLW